MAENDQWSKWLLEARFGGDKQAAEAGMRQLHGISDELLKNAAIKRVRRCWTPGVETASWPSLHWNAPVAAAT